MICQVEHMKVKKEAINISNWEGMIKVKNIVNKMWSTNSCCNSAIQLVKMHMRSTPLIASIVRSTACARRHDTENINIVSMYRGSNQKGATWIKT